MKALGIMTYTTFLLIGGSIWRGYVLSILWAWFIVTTFSLAPLSVVQAIGVSLMINAFTYDGKDVEAKKDDDSPLLTMTLKIVLIPLLFLAFGWITKQFM